MAIALSAVIVIYRTGAALWPCLDAVFAAPEIDEIVLVDNGSAPPDAARLVMLARDRADVVLLQGHGNVGFGAGCNRGAAAACGTHLLFLNPDLTLDPGAPMAMLDALIGARRPAVVGGALRDAVGREQRGARRAAVTLGSSFASFTGLARFERFAPVLRGVDRRADPLPSGPTPQPVVSGALMLMARADFEMLGGFDERYFLHVEDIDLCRRAEAAGGGAVYAPGATARHVGGASEASAVFVARHKAESFHRYFRKFARGPLERIAAEAAGVALRGLLPLRALVTRRG